jgi:Trypsin-like peptidase domain
MSCARIGVIGVMLWPSLGNAEPIGSCRGAYAEDLSALTPLARDAESRTPSYSYAVRSTATYECVSYGSDGGLRKSQLTVTSHGTAFGYRRDGGDTLLLTNHHVAEWPAVTDSDHAVGDVPTGCKRVADSLKIVDDDRDAYAADDIALARVVVDPALDIAILRAHAALEIIPWRIGKSSALAARAVIEVKGFPLGRFQATNVGKVISAYDHDEQADWNHDDFVVDALLSSGGSGSPVLAVSCKTGEFELVGVFHAHYSGGSALNVVIAIDQVRDLMTTLKRAPRPTGEPAIELDATARARIVDATKRDPDPAFFAFGPLVASVKTRADGSLVFTVFPAEFPRVSRPLLVIEDRVATDPKAFGTLGATYLGGPRPIHAFVPGDADADTQALLGRVLNTLRRDAIAAFDNRDASRSPIASRDAYERNAKRKRALSRLLDAQRDTALAVADLAARTPAAANERSVTLADIEAGSAPADVAGTR